MAATMGKSSVDRLARSKRPTVERSEIHIPPAPVFPLEAVTGDPARRAQAVAAFNNALQKWRNDAWSIEAPFVPDAALQADVATLQDTTAKVATKLDRAAVDIRRTEANVTTISTSVTNIDNSITEINNEITNINNAITGTGIVQANGANPPTAILGTPGHVPYWTSVGPPYISPTSPIYISGTIVGIGTDLPAGALLDLGLAGVTAGTVRLAGSAGGNVTIQTAAIAGTWTLTLPVNDGNAGDVFTTDGGGISSWTAPATVTPAALTRVDDTNITLTLGGSPTVALLAATSLTLGWAGLLSIARGGTASGAFTPFGIVFAESVGPSLTSDPFLTYGAYGTNTIRTVSDTTTWEAFEFLQFGQLATDVIKIGFGLEGTDGIDTYSYWTVGKEQNWTGVASTRDSYIAFETVLNNVVAEKVRFTSAGAIDTVLGFRIGGAAGNQQYLRGDGTNFVSSGLVITDASGVLPIANGGTNNTAFNTNSVIFYDGTRLTDDGAAFTYGAAGDNQLIIARAMGAVSSNSIGLALLNTSAAALGAQQWSPPMIFEGQGWDSGGSTSQSVLYRNYVVPVQAATNPTGYWLLERSINNAAFVELLRADSTGFLRVLKDDIRITQGAYGLHVTNSTPATSSSLLQQWSPPVIYEGQGWKTNATAASQRVQFRNYVAPVIGAAAPTAYFVTDYDINATGTFTEALRLDTSGFYRLTKDALGNTTNTGQIGLQLINNTAATAGLNQNSPVVLFRGFGWKTNAVAASQQVQFRMHVVPVTGGAAPTAMLRIDSEIAGAGSFTQPITISSLGSMSVGAQYEPPFGVLNVQVGFKVGTAATLGQVLRGDGTNFIPATLSSATDFPHALLSATHTDTTASAVSRGSLIVGIGASPAWAELNIGAAARLLRSDGTDASWAQAVLTTDVTGVLPVANGGTNKNSWTAGSVAFAGAGGLALAETAASFVWDYTLLRLGIGNNAPGVLLDLGLAGTTAGIMRLAGLTSGSVTIKTASIAGSWTLTLPATVGNSGDVLTSNGSVTSWQPPTASATHDMLSATHTDTTPSAVSRGSLIVGIGSAPTTWSEYAIGPTARLLRSDGTDATWAQAVLTTDVTGLLPMANGGTNKLMVASAGAVAFSDVDSLELTAVGSVGQVLLSNGTGTPFWSSGSPLLNLWFEGSGANWQSTQTSVYENVVFGSGAFELSLTAGTWLVIAIITTTDPATNDHLFQLDDGASGLTKSEQQWYGATSSGNREQIILHYRVTVGSTTTITVQAQSTNTAYTFWEVIADYSNISAIRLTA